MPTQPRTAVSVLSPMSLDAGSASRWMDVTTKRRPRGCCCTSQTSVKVNLSDYSGEGKTNFPSTLPGLKQAGAAPG